MICSDDLLDNVSAKACPQTILRGFSGIIKLQDWRGFNDYSQDEQFNSEIEIEVDEFSIKPDSKPEVRKDNLTVYIHHLSAKIKNVSKEALESLAEMSNVPLIVTLYLKDGVNKMIMFKTAGAKILLTNNFFGGSCEYSMLDFVHYHREAREETPPLIEPIVPPVFPYIVDFNIDEASEGSFSIYGQIANGIYFSVYNITQDITLRENEVLEGTMLKTTSFTANQGDIIRFVVWTEEGYSYDVLRITDWLGFNKTIIDEGDPILNMTYQQSLSFKMTGGVSGGFYVDKVNGERLEYSIDGGSFNDVTNVSQFFITVPEGQEHRICFRLFDSPIAITLGDTLSELISEGSYSGLYTLN